MADVGIERGAVVATIDQTADVPVAASATHVDVTGLSFDMDAGVNYSVRGRITATSSAASQDVDAAVSGVTDLTGFWTWITQNASDVHVPASEILAAGAVAASAVTDIAGATDVGHIWFEGVISSAAGGTLQLQAAQGTAAGTTTIADSTMQVHIINQ